MKYLLLVFFTILFYPSNAQKYTFEKGKITFFSDAVVEDIHAVNTAVGSMFNEITGDVVFVVKIKDFSFEKSLMREHFNEKYLESEKYPKATFIGKISGYKENISVDQKVRATGMLSMHGVIKKLDASGSIRFINKGVEVKSKFILKLIDFNIRIPRVLWQNIAEEVEVKVEFTYKPI
jgi:hypothetical protein